MSLDHPSEHEDDDLDTQTYGPLNEEDILWGVERAMSSFEGRATEKRVLAAPTDADARATLVAACRWWGGGGPAYNDEPSYSYDAESRGLRVQRGMRKGLITWDEMIQRVRHPETIAPQLALF